LADARLPTGAHTQSAGLEPALRGGMLPEQVPKYIQARLRTVTLVEAGAAVLARAAVISDAPSPPRADQLRPSGTGGTGVNDFVRAGEDDPRGQVAVARNGTAVGEETACLAAALGEVDAAWRARTVSPAVRETSVLLGRGYLRLVGQLWPGSAGAAALQAIGRPGRAVVLGVAAALAGLSAAQLVRLIGYDDAQTVAAATLKLEPLDPVVATSWVMAAQADIERMVDQIAALTDVTQLPAFGAPLIEQWAEIHATTSQRLFRA
ncbi:MAG: urease accessory UreF family protein, partial [Nakamurella sp.]